MKSILRGHGLILSASLLVALAGCGGGGNTPGAATATTHAPVATAPTWTPAGTSLSEYSVYTFSTTATDPDFGVGIASYQWTFGDGSATVSTTVPTVTYSYANAGSYTLQVAATNTAGVQGAAAGETVTVVAAPNPFTVTPTSPSAATTLQVASGSTAGVQITFAFNVTDSDGGTIVPAGVTLNPGDANAVVGTPVAGASGAWTVPVTYGAGTTTGSRTANPTVQVADSLGIGSLVTAFPVITVNTAVQNTATTPSITLTAPTAATTNAFSSVQQTLAFTLTDLNGNPLNYTVNWGDGTTAVTATVTSGTQAGAAISLQHSYPDTYATPGTPKLANVTIDCSDGTLSAPQVKLAFLVAFNTYPTATITSPQASGTVPAAVANLGLPATDPPVVILPINGIANFAGLFTRPGSEVSAGTSQVSYSWTFPGGVPSSSNVQNPGDVVFAGTQGKVTQYLVTFTVTDDLGRLSSADPTMAAPAATLQAFQQTFQRIIVVDGLDSQTFTMSFLYRQRSGTSSPDLYTLATTTGHGYNAAVQVFQDGINNTYNVANNASAATTQIPVRSDVPFWLSIPSIAGDVADTSQYMFSIPNAPGLDPDLENSGTGLARTLQPSEGTAFAFQNSGTTGPWNPQLQITTGSGFGTEILAASNRTFQGTDDLLSDWCAASSSYVGTYRWLDRLSIPITNPVVGTAPNAAYNQPPNDIYRFSGIVGYQTIPEWFVFLESIATQDWESLTSPLPSASTYQTSAGPTSFQFVVDDATYNAITAESQHFAMGAIEAYRAPASTADPYDFDVMKAKFSVPGSAALLGSNLDYTMGLNPSPLAAPATTFMSGLLSTSPSTTTPLSGGLYQITVPYDINNVDRPPSSPTTYNAFNEQYNPSTGQTTSTFSNFSYCEYLWTRVWARPLVLNRTNLSWYDTLHGFASYNSIAPPIAAGPEECGSGTETGAVTPWPLPWFFYSNPQATNPNWITGSNPGGHNFNTSPYLWPSGTNVSPDNSSYNLNVANGGTFDASSPVTEGTATGTTTGVGRFFWTAFTPHYNAVPGALISRTWLSASNSQIPTSFSGGTTANPETSDAATAWGFLPPQDTQIDKRARNTNGTGVNGTTTGYRVLWYNPTKDINGLPIPPDFWAVQVVEGSNTQMFLLSGNFPRTGQNSLTNTLVTDLQSYLPSGKSTFQTGDLAGPGYCWFDIPLELRPPTGTTATVTVFALKAILKNNPVSNPNVQVARVINRSEWVEAVKTVTASISAKPQGADVGFAHKVSFNFPWDIVVVNGPATLVAAN